MHRCHLLPNYTDVDNATAANSWTHEYVDDVVLVVGVLPPQELEYLELHKRLRVEHTVTVCVETFIQKNNY